MSEKEDDGELLVNQYIRYVPNLLSTIRLCLAFAFPFCAVKLWIWLIIGGGISDFLDGWIARKWNVASWQGGLLDAIADKLFILLALATFSHAGVFSPWWIFAVISRDLTVVFTAGYAALCRSWTSFQAMDSRWSGKCATAGQFLLLFSVVLFPSTISMILYLAVIISIVAAVDYGILFIKAVQEVSNVRQ